MSAFEKLQDELNSLASDQDTMHKALPADDGKDDKSIQAAAAEGGGVDDDDDDEDKDDKRDDGDDDDDDKPLGKSLGVVTLPNGDKAEAVDGTELVKALMGQVEALGAKQAEGEGAMLKALETCVGLVKGQGALIKSLQDEVVKLRGEGRGRKSALTVLEKPGAGDQLHKSDPAQMTGADFMAKSNAAFEAKKISGVELTTIDVSLRSGVPIDANLIKKVIS